MKIIITIIAVFYWTFTHSQSNIFKAQIFAEDSSLLVGGAIIFPLTKDTLAIGSSNTAVIKLNNLNNRIFYFVWFGLKSKVFRFTNNETSSDTQKIYVPDTLFYQEFEKKLTCPICLKSKQVIPITYGKPSLKTIQEANLGKCRLGGCIVGWYSPRYYCKLDDFEF